MLYVYVKSSFIQSDFGLTFTMTNIHHQAADQSGQAKIN